MTDKQDAKGAMYDEKVVLNCGVCGRFFSTPRLPDDLAGEYWDICSDCDEPHPESKEVALGCN